MRVLVVGTDALAAEVTAVGLTVTTRAGDAVAVVLDGGPARGGPPSTVVDCTVDPPRILRAGAIAVGDIEAVLGIAVEPPGSR